VSIGQGAVLGLASVATKDLEPWMIYQGVPAVPVKTRAPSPQDAMLMRSDP
jgi:putative colanic acid biosynthesis acetyltransferase WcaF